MNDDLLSRRDCAAGSKEVHDKMLLGQFDHDNTTRPQHWFLALSSRSSLTFPQRDCNSFPCALALNHNLRTDNLFVVSPFFLECDVFVLSYRPGQLVGLPFLLRVICDADLFLRTWKGIGDFIHPHLAVHCALTP